jgi:hypothetical protein
VTTGFVRGADGDGTASTEVPTTDGDVARVPRNLTSARALPAAHRALREIVVYREFIEVTGFLRREYPEKNVLLVSDLSHLYTPFRYGALKFERVNREPQRIAQWYRQRQGRDVVAIQRIQLATGRPTAATTLAPGYVTEVIDEAPLGDDVFLRFSRVQFRTEPDTGPR